MTYTPSSPEEKDFLDAYDASAYPSIALTADLLIFTIRNGKLCLLLVRRGDHPYKDFWALPGGFAHIDESAEDAAHRELFEETGLSVDIEQLKTYTNPDRDPRMRVVSTAFVALVPDMPLPHAGDDAADARYFPVEDLNLLHSDPLGELDTLLRAEEQVTLAFDHAEVIRDGLERVRSKFEYTPLATKFLDETFTLADLRRVYEAVWGEEIHPANFRRKVLSTSGFVEQVGERGQSVSGGRSADLYRAGRSVLLHPALLRRGINNRINDTHIEEGVEVSDS